MGDPGEPPTLSKEAPGQGTVHRLMSWTRRRWRSLFFAAVAIYIVGPRIETTIHPCGYEPVRGPVPPRCTTTLLRTTTPPLRFIGWNEGGPTIRDNPGLLGFGVCGSESCD